MRCCLIMIWFSGYYRLGGSLLAPGRGLGASAGGCHEGGGVLPISLQRYGKEVGTTAYNRGKMTADAMIAAVGRERAAAMGLLSVKRILKNLGRVLAVAIICSNFVAIGATVPAITVTTTKHHE